MGAERRRERRTAIVPAACSRTSLQALHNKAASGSQGPVPTARPVRSDPPGRQGLRPCPSRRASCCSRRVGGQPRPPPRPGRLVLLFWQKRECVRVHRTRSGGESRATAQGAPALTPQLAEGGRPGWAVDSGHLASRAEVTTEARWSRGARAALEPHGLLCVCVCVCVWAPGPPPWVEELGAALSLERSPQLEPGGCGERVWVAEPRPRREPRTDAQGDRRAAERASGTAAQGLSSSPPASSLPAPPSSLAVQPAPDRHSGQQRTRTHPPLQRENKSWRKNSVFSGGAGGC